MRKSEISSAENTDNTLEHITNQDRSIEKWEGIVQQAEAGDVDAMYRLGVLLVFDWTNPEMTGLEPDFDRGYQFIKRAANLGHADARLYLWSREESNDLDELLNIANSVVEQNLEYSRMFGISGWLQWKGLETCDSRFIAKAQKVTDYVVKTGLKSDAVALQTKFEDDFENQCRIPSD